MSHSRLVGVISDTSPAAAGTAVSAATVSGLEAYDWFSVEADLTEEAGDTLDVYIQRKIANNLWRDWIHFPQLAAGSTVYKYSVQPQSSAAPIVVGGGTDASPGVALAANTSVGGHPGTEVRAVYVAGASASTGAAQTIRIMGWKN